jgi:hypothetical protein
MESLAKSAQDVDSSSLRKLVEAGAPEGDDKIAKEALLPGFGGRYEVVSAPRGLLKIPRPPKANPRFQYFYMGDICGRS